MRHGTHPDDLIERDAKPFARCAHDHLAADSHSFKDRAQVQSRRELSGVEHLNPIDSQTGEQSEPVTVGIDIEIDHYRWFARIANVEWTGVQAPQLPGHDINGELGELRVLRVKHLCCHWTVRGQFGVALVNEIHRYQYPEEQAACSTVRKGSKHAQQVDTGGVVAGLTA